MIVLAIDTALAACSAAVLDTASHGPALAERVEPMARGHAEALMPLIGGLMEETGIGLAGIDRFAVTVGPGTFTGVRIGVAAVRGFALATGRPAVGVTTLAALDETARMAGHGESPIVVAIDARRGEAYAQCFDASGAPLSHPAVAPVSDIVGTLPEGVTGAFGSAATAVAKEATRQGRQMVVLGTADAPRPAAVARLGAVPAPDLAPAPLYLRPPDARPQVGATIARR